MKEKARVAILAVIMAVMTMAALPANTAKAESSPDYAIPNGHFYTQANGSSANNSNLGYSITDEEGIPFWTFYRNLGGPNALGYPISQRFIWDGHVCQATQRGILQWDAEDEQVQLVNILDHLSLMGKNDWLQQVYLVPQPLDSQIEAGMSFEEIQKRRLELLEANEALSDYFHQASDPLALYGLPASAVVDIGPAYAIRTQRSALFVWKGKTPWADEGEVTVALAGEAAKIAGLVPEEATKPIEPGARYVPSSRWGGRETSGTATWYGRAFHGRLMRNGEPFNMYDPTITACNAYPLGTLLQVTNVSTGKSIIVRVTDTGGFSWPIVVDLSWAAFSQLGDPYHGVIYVTIQPVEVSRTTLASDGS